MSRKVCPRSTEGRAQFDSTQPPSIPPYKPLSICKLSPSQLLTSFFLFFSKNLAGPRFTSTFLSLSTLQNNNVKHRRSTFYKMSKTFNILTLPIPSALTATPIPILKKQLTAFILNPKHHDFLSVIKVSFSSRPIVLAEFRNPISDLSETDQTDLSPPFLLSLSLGWSKWIGIWFQSQVSSCSYNGHLVRIRSLVTQSFGSFEGNQTSWIQFDEVCHDLQIHSVGS